MASFEGLKDTQTMLAAYKGISVMSRAIRFFNDGPYSHVAWVDGETGDVYEAWTSGVRKIPSVHHGHTPGTPVDIFRIQGEEHCRATAIRMFMVDKLGKPYDWPGVFRFMTRGSETDTDNPPHWFCSRLVACAFRRAGMPLLHAPDWKINPTDCTYSLRCDPVSVRSLLTVDTNLFDNRAIRGIARSVDDPFEIYQNE